MTKIIGKVAPLVAFTTNSTKFQEMSKAIHQIELHYRDKELEKITGPNGEKNQHEGRTQRPAYGQRANHKKIHR